MKFNIDNLFRTKLSEVNYDFKPEYWKEMEQMLDKEGGAGASVGGFFGSSFFLKTAIIITIAVLIGIFSFMFFGKDKQNNTAPEINTETTINNNTTLVTPTLESIENNTEIADDAIAADEEIITTTTTKSRKTILIDYFKISPTIVEYIGAKLDKELDIKIMRNLKPYQIDQDALENDDEPLESDFTEQIKDKPVINTKVVEKPDEPKNVRPMEKPVKHVFKKKKGLLWYLGFRR